jgi:hypothetical protein
MADYDAGAVGGILVGQSPLGSENIFDFPRGAGATQTASIAGDESVPVPLEPVYSVGAIFSIGLSFTETGAYRTVPVLIRPPS